MKSLIKELFIIILLLIIVAFVIMLLFYDYLPSNKVIPEAVEYVPDSKIAATLQEIKSTTELEGADSSKEETTLLKSYSIGKYDLKNYESKNAFESGKANPFAEYAEDANAVTDSNTVNTNTVSNTTGTFFESSNSK